MAEFFEADESVKELDITIIKRIFSYVRPYKILLILATLALVITTVGELFIPILVQHTVDDALVVSYSALDRSAKEKLNSALPWDEAIELGDIFYVKKSFVSKIDNQMRKSLIEEKLLETGPFYLTEWNKELSSLPKNIQEALLLQDDVFLKEGYFVASLDYVQSLSAEDAKILRQEDQRTVNKNVAIFFALLIFVLLATFSQVWSSNLIGQRVMKALRMDLFEKTLSQSLHFLSLQPVGRLVTRLTSDVDTINAFFSDVVIPFIKDISIMIGVLVTLFILSPRLALICSLSLPPVLVVTSISRKKARDAFRKQRTWLSKVNAFISEHISGVSIVKLFGRESSVSKEFASHNKELLKANLGEMYVYATFRPVIEFFSSTTMAILLYFGAGFHDSGIVSLGTLIAFVNLLRMFYSPLQDIAEKYTMLQNAMAGGERVFKLLDTDERILDAPSQSLVEPVKGRIEFDKVWFAYKGEDWVIKDLSFTVEAGESLAIVGYTGSGKTTLALLLSRMWDIQKGEIRLDGVPIKNIPLRDLRRAIRPVMQDVFLFSGSIEENIGLGLDLTKAEIEAALETVNAETFVKQLPEREQTILGEGALTLSSGQRQLLSFARVVAHKPAIVVLDEATSSIDTETEQLVQKGLEGLLKGRTSIAIAHRLSTIKKADKIIVLSKGRLVEEGSHDELIKKQGLYYALYKLQYEET
jgi:ATP-binding cassette subfamily B multidrug efflux pump